MKILISRSKAGTNEPFAGEKAKYMNTAWGKILNFSNCPADYQNDMLDDIIYCMLEYVKANGCDKPFDELHERVMDGKMFGNMPEFQSRLAVRLMDDKKEIDKFKSTDATLKAVAKDRLRNRGFIGGREIYGM